MIEGFVHLSELDCIEPGEEALQDYNKGDIVKTQVIGIDVETGRIELSFKALRI